MLFAAIIIIIVIIAMSITMITVTAISSSTTTSNGTGTSAGVARRFPKLSSQLRGWISKQTLPAPDIGIAELEGADIDELTTAYETLRECEFGPTGTAKALFAVRPKSAMAWDEPIRTAFGLADGGYRNMLKASRVEAQALLAAAKQYGITDIAKAVGSPDYVSVAKLLDEYHWITITRGHRIPFRNELEMWLSWVPK